MFNVAYEVLVHFLSSWVVHPPIFMELMLHPEVHLGDSWFSRTIAVMPSVLMARVSDFDPVSHN